MIGVNIFIKFSVWLEIVRENLVATYLFKTLKIDLIEVNAESYRDFSADILVDILSNITFETKFLK